MKRILYDRADPGPEEKEASKSDSVDKENRSHSGSGDEERNDEKVIESPRYDPELPGLRSFFGRSWVELPDSSSLSRVMKARCVMSFGAPFLA